MDELKNRMEMKAGSLELERNREKAELERAQIAAGLMGKMQAEEAKGHFEQLAQEVHERARQSNAEIAAERAKSTKLETEVIMARQLAAKAEAERQEQVGNLRAEGAHFASQVAADKQALQRQVEHERSVSRQFERLPSFTNSRWMLFMLLWR